VLTETDLPFGFPLLTSKPQLYRGPRSVIVVVRELDSVGSIVTLCCLVVVVVLVVDVVGAVVVVVHPTIPTAKTTITNGVSFFMPSCSKIALGCHS
jgi:hypothetical protein